MGVLGHAELKKGQEKNLRYATYVPHHRVMITSEGGGGGRLVTRAERRKQARDRKRQQCRNPPEWERTLLRVFCLSLSPRPPTPFRFSARKMRQHFAVLRRSGRQQGKTIKIYIGSRCGNCLCLLYNSRSVLICLREYQHLNTHAVGGENALHCPTHKHAQVHGQDRPSCPPLALLPAALAKITFQSARRKFFFLCAFDTRQSQTSARLLHLETLHRGRIACHAGCCHC